MTYFEVLEFSKHITKKFGGNYYQATKLFPPKIREAVFLYYAWTRIADEYVDSGFSKEKAEMLLENWIHDWQKTVEGNRNEYDIHWYMKQIFERYNTPLEFGGVFLGVMKQDIGTVRYEHYRDLEAYMYGSAVVIGFTMLSFFGLLTEDRKPSARAFGEAMQLTNFLRDIREDYEQLGRIYIPQEDMRRFGVSEEDIRIRSTNENFKRLMQFEISRCRELYQKAWIGIEQLPWRIKVPLRIAARKYEGILREIEKHDYDVWSKKHVLSRNKKLLLVIKSLFV